MVPKYELRVLSPSGDEKSFGMVPNLGDAEVLKLCKRVLEEESRSGLVGYKVYALTPKEHIDLWGHPSIYRYDEFGGYFS